jgi:hypothetical protein
MKTGQGEDTNQDDIYSSLVAPAEFHSGEDEGGDEGEGEGGSDEGKGGDELDEATKSAAQFRQTLQSSLTKRFGREVKVPETVTLETADEFLVGLVEESLHPEVRRFQAALAQGKKPADYFSEINHSDRLIAMNDQELVAHALRSKYGRSEANPSGWDDDKITRHVKAMEATPEQMELQAEQIREGLRKEKAEREKELERYSPRQRVDYGSAEFIAGFTKEAQSAMENVVKEADGDFYGIDLSKDGAVSVLTKRAIELIKPNPKTGISEFDADLQSNDAVIKMALLWDMAKRGRLRAYVNQEKQKAKADILDRLDLTPRAAKGGQRKETAIDLELASRPSGFRDY